MEYVVFKPDLVSREIDTAVGAVRLMRCDW